MVQAAMPVISIIVPVYRVEPYLRRCLDSILAQTFTDWECILVDDGSPDRCPAICDGYAARDSRFRVIHRKNAGVSAARNAGLDAARGEWIGFVDSDDWCEPEWIEELYHAAVTNGADIAKCRIRRVRGAGNTPPLRGFRRAKRAARIFTGTGAITRMLAGKLSGFDSGPIGLYNAACLKENRVRFDSALKYGEDTLFVYQVLKLSGTAVFVPAEYYNYFKGNPASITGQKHLTEARKTVFLAYDRMLGMEEKRRIRSRILSRRAREAYWMLLPYLRAKDFSCGEYHFLRTNLAKDIKHTLADPSASPRMKVLCCLALFPNLHGCFSGAWKAVKNVFVRVPS
jgi:glycosyltransferase involved in cell wall biosynthesis